MDITPIIPEGKKVIKSYGEGGFTINETEHSYSIILSPSIVQKWNVRNLEELSLDNIREINIDGSTEIVILGCGERHIPIPHDIQRHFAALDIGVEIMTTGAACRTYNVLLAEGRDIIAMLIAV